MTRHCHYTRCGIQLLRLHRDWRVGRDDVDRILCFRFGKDGAISGQHVHRLAHLDADDSALDDGNGGARNARSKSL